MKFRQRPNGFGVSGKVGVTLQRVLRILARNLKVYLLYLNQEETSELIVWFIQNVLIQVPPGPFCFQQWGNTGAIWSDLCSPRLFKKLLKLGAITVTQAQCLICASHAINISGMNENELKRVEAERPFMNGRLMKACSGPAQRCWGLN